MPRDECTVCERHFPDGDGLIDGRCPDCQTDFEERRRAPKPKKTKSQRESAEEE